MKINEVIATEAKATAGPDKCWTGYKKLEQSLAQEKTKVKQLTTVKKSKCDIIS